MTSYLRPIISSIGARDYNLTKFSSALLKPVIFIRQCTEDSFKLEILMLQINA